MTSKRRTKGDGTLTEDEAHRRRDEALAALGITLDEWREQQAGHHCPCCADEELRREHVYPTNSWANDATLDTISDMTYLLGERNG